MRIGSIARRILADPRVRRAANAAIRAALTPPRRRRRRGRRGGLPRIIFPGMR